MFNTDGRGIVRGVGGAEGGWRWWREGCDVGSGVYGREGSGDKVGREGGGDGRQWGRNEREEADFVTARLLFLGNIYMTGIYRTL